MYSKIRNKLEVWRPLTMKFLKNLLGWLLPRHIIIATHDGPFHTDDTFGCATGKLYFQKLYPSAYIEIIRTRDPKILAKADMVVDVGNIYNPDTLRCDHHQGGVWSHRNGIPTAALGLVWAICGKIICDGNEAVYRKIKTVLIYHVDAIDNGKEVSTLNYKRMHVATIREAIRTFLPSNDELNHKFNYDTAFDRAVAFAEHYLSREIQKALDEERLIPEVTEHFKTSESKEVLIFDKFLPWAEVLRQFPDPKFVVGPSNTNKGAWSVTSVNKQRELKDTQLYLPEIWRGKIGSELGALTGYDDVLFSNPNGFNMVAESKETCIKLAELAIELSRKTLI